MKKRFLAMLMAMLIMLVSVASTQVFAADPQPQETFTVTVDFDGHGENVEIPNVPYGTGLGQVAYDAVPDAPEAEGYLAFTITAKPASEYDSFEDADAAGEELWSTAVTSDVTVYVCWLELIDEVRINVEQPVCGTETTIQDYADSDEHNSIIQTNPPTVTINDERLDDGYIATWIVDGESLSYDAFVPYTGKFVSGEKYKVIIEKLQAKYPYTLDTKTKFFVNDIKPDYEICILQDINYCGSVMAFVEGAHDWSEWEVVEEPTYDTPGLERRVCLGYPESHYEERDIPPLNSGTDDEINSNTYYFTFDGTYTYTAGSGKNLNLTVKSEPDDGETFMNFIGIEIDGTSVDVSDYDASEGSVNLSLHADYLDTLAEGEHTLTVLFEDGEAETELVIAEDPNSYENADEDIDEDIENTPSDDDPIAVPTGDNGSQTIWIMLMAISLAVFCTAFLSNNGRYKGKYFSK